VPGDKKSEIEDGVAKLRGMLDSDDAAAIKAATEGLMEQVQAIGAAAYQQAGPEMGGTDAGDGGQPSDEEDVVEGEFKEEGDEDSGDEDAE